MDFDNAETNGDVKISKFHGAFDQLARIGNLWKQMHTDVRNGNFALWNLGLDRVWLELSGDIETDSGLNKEFEKIDTELVKLFPLIGSSVSGFKERSKEDNERIGQQYLTLKKKETFIRRVQNMTGKGSAYEDPYEDDF